MVKLLEDKSRLVKFVRFSILSGRVVNSLRDKIRTSKFARLPILSGRDLNALRDKYRLFKFVRFLILSGRVLNLLSDKFRLVNFVRFPILSGRDVKLLRDKSKLFIFLNLFLNLSLSSTLKIFSRRLLKPIGIFLITNSSILCLDSIFVLIFSILLLMSSTAILSTVIVTIFELDSITFLLNGFTSLMFFLSLSPRYLKIFSVAVSGTSFLTPPC